MKVSFIYLPHPYLKQPDAQAPLGLMYLAAVLEKENIEADIKNYSSWPIDKAIIDLPEAALYGITITSLELPYANRFAQLIKYKYPNSKVVLGGPGTVTPELVDFGPVDSVCHGEAEKTIFDILNDAQNGNLKKEYISDPVDDLDTIPFPARHMLDFQGGNVFIFDKKYRSGETTIFLTTRGCPFKCTFCSSPKLSHKVRFRSIDNIISEMKYVMEEYGITQFRISDDLFTVKKDRVLELCEEIGKLDVVWRASVRVKPFDEEMAQVMYDSGCMEVSPGVETFDDHVLKILNKGTTAKDNVDFLEMMDRIGIKCRILLMVRTPGQTKDTMRINREYLERVPYEMIAAKSFIPLPGSDIWDNPDKYDIEILDRNLENYNYFFYGPLGRYDLHDLFRFTKRDMDEVNKETLEFMDWLDTTGKLNKG